ncbi:GNAT family N-acetyltransferase [Ramlibacter sp.]|uniref:GNAT family N-acetyltransferase n=1 Tax=Ramlibacter sp. TaxID=1917967 RepID=UPI002607840F|nr:GNAT family N-acetyltransferase [Ramlibacter sp.]MDB5953653.1 family N-acetyltransferase [Ramlibacter sp.]
MKQQQQQTAGASPDLRHNEAQSRYELMVDGELAAHADYAREGDAVRFTHTEVVPEREGQGLAARLAAYALDDVRTRGLKAIPQCSYIAGYIARHEKEYGALVVK